ncbi:alpha/beta hydrolase [Telmatospirillum sp.]|uniref:alpha/beta hydrolase n=1 Tax=Telmatospirillum sp. TaxID=2079197 RepID=UPI00283FAA39|nr:alpha/beta hydrolase [Telmatospirillum sp.]MDR3440902.1 alpha/beta hydrolase [Telmatospirillum sp.]
MLPPAHAHRHRLAVLRLFLGTVLGLMAGGAVAFSLALYVGQRHLLFENYVYGDIANPKQSGFSGIQVVRVHTSDGLALSSWYRKAYPGCPTIVYFHGNEGDVKSRAFKLEPLLHAGYGVFLIEYRGYGGNPGAPSEKGLYEDSRSSLRLLAQDGLPIAETIFMGESLGTGVAVKMATEFPPAKLVLLAPYTTITDVTSGMYWFLPVGLLSRDRFPSINRIVRVKAPLLIIHGEDDETVPVALGRNLLAAANEPKTAVFLKGAGHDNLFAYGAVDAIMDFADPQHRCTASQEVLP